MCEKCDTLNELLQTSAHACKLLLSSEIAINNGEIAECQKYTKEAQDLVGFLTKDTFLEYEEKFETTNVLDISSYELPSTLELAKALTNLQYNIGILLSFNDETQAGTLEKTTINQIQKDINTVKKLYNELYNN